MHREKRRAPSPAMKSTEVPNLPPDVLFDILSWLTVKPLLRFRVVCKRFLSRIDDPHFIKLHRHRSIPNPNHLLIYHESTDDKNQYYTVCTAAPDNSSLIEHKKLKFPFKPANEYVRIVGSSDGLVCLFDTNDRSSFGALYLWNPMVGRFRVLPDSHLTHKLRGTFSHMVVGFSFVKEIDDFKVVQLLYNSYEKIVPDGWVYSMESDSWRRVLANAPCYMPDRWATNVCFNGVMHWMAYKKPCYMPNRWATRHVCDAIMSFDLKDEVFGQIALPRVHYGQVELCVSASGDSLSLFFGINKRWDVWVMKEYGVVESWTRQFTIAAEHSLPLKFMDNGDVLLVTSKGKGKGKGKGKLVVCDPESQQMKDLGVCGLPGSFRVVSYMSSLLLLDTGSKLLE